MKRHILSALIITSVAAAPAHAQDKTAGIDRIFGWATPSTPGCSVAVADKGTLVATRAYGLADLERDVPITPDSVFDAGSVVKQFVAAATLLLVEEGRLSLTEDIHKYVPELPDYGHTITLDHLLTHTSGIRDWDGLMPLTNGKASALTLTLRQRALNFAPGDEWSYSNSGYVLLKEIVARTSGMSFGDFTRTRIFEPLGMKATRYVADLQEVVRNRALAYDKTGGRWRLDVQVANERGGGGALLATAGDLILWNQALTDARLGSFVTAKLQEPATLANGRKLGYARGLFIDSNRGGHVVWHTGGAGGYKSVLARFIESGLSVAALCNAGDVSDGTIGFARGIFDVFVPDTAAPATPSDAPGAGGAEPPAGLDVTNKAGLFFNERTGQPLRLVADNGRLRVQGGPPLVAVTAERFRNPRGSLNFMSGDMFELRFLMSGALELTSMEGQTTRFRRAEPYAPSAADLEGFAGRYRSDEIGGFVDLSAGNGGLIGRANDDGGPGLPFRPVDRDTFQLAGVILRFRRDAANRIIGLDYSNPVVRNVAFARVSDTKAGS